MLSKEEVVRFPLDQLTGPEPERLRTRTPPSPGRLTAGFGSPDVVASWVGGHGGVDLLPDVVQVVALGQGGDNCQTGLSHREPKAAELTMVIGWCMGVTDSKAMNQE
jgi:hypothetical protein